MSAPDARSLFDAAREDAPADGQRDAMFRELALATGIATTAATAGALSSAASPSAAASTPSGAAQAVVSAAAKTGGAAGLKSLVVVAALGAISTALGALLAVTIVLPEPPRSPARAASAKAPATVRVGAKLAQPGARRRDLGDGHARSHEPAATRADASAAASTTPTRVTRSAVGASDLTEEARLVTAARHALLAGDPGAALALMQSTHKWSSRSLEPEELGLEARALRALGRADEAAETELLLRRRYPDHALAR